MGSLYGCYRMNSTMNKYTVVGETERYITIARGDNTLLGVELLMMIEEVEEATGATYVCSGVIKEGRMWFMSSSHIFRKSVTNGFEGFKRAAA